MEHLSDHELAWYPFPEGERIYRAGTGIPANDPPGTRYAVWYTNLSDKGYVKDAPPRLLDTGPGFPSFGAAMNHAAYCSRKRVYPFGAYHIVPVGETPGGKVGYSMLTG